MKQITYSLIVAALITTAPFLLTFEKGQDIIHGIFGYSTLALILLFAFIKEKLNTKIKWPLLVLTGTVLFVVAIFDLQNILDYKQATIGWEIAIPITTCVISILMLKSIKALTLNGISIFLFLILMSHFLLIHIFPEQPLLEFPIAKRLARMVPKNPDRNYLSADYRIRYSVIDSTSITKYHIDTSRSNVVVLVESWGIPMDSAKFNEELAVFEGLLTGRGVHFRMYSRTRTAEREDLLDSAWRDSTGKRDSLFMPKRFVELGNNTTFLFGGDSTIQWRYKYIRNIGFQNAIWTDSATADIVMAAKIDSLLNQSDSTKHFIAWTTRDTRFPISDDAVETEKLYYERLFGTLQIVADLAKKHPDVRFIVQGDHEPILSPFEFQAKFYRRWVPYVVLN